MQNLVNMNAKNAFLSPVIHSNQSKKANIYSYQYFNDNMMIIHSKKPPSEQRKKTSTSFQRYKYLSEEPQKKIDPINYSSLVNTMSNNNPPNRNVSKEIQDKSRTILNYLKYKQACQPNEDKSLKKMPVFSNEFVKERTEVITTENHKPLITERNAILDLNKRDKNMPKMQKNDYLVKFCKRSNSLLADHLNINDPVKIKGKAVELEKQGDSSSNYGTATMRNIMRKKLKKVDVKTCIINNIQSDSFYI